MDRDHEDHEAEMPGPERPSKSQLKRAMQALQDLGEELVNLPGNKLDELDLPEALYDAVLEARRITKHEARRRQMQYIGRLMRDLDTGGIAGQMAQIKGESDAAKAAFHAVERWRDRLITDDAALTAWLAEHPGEDVQSLRNLIRNARKEAAAGKPPRSSRELFRRLRERLAP